MAALGLGYLFIALNSVYATPVFALLFGTVVGISRDQVWLTGLLALGCLAALAWLYRPLLLATIDGEVATARGVPVRLIGLLFLMVVAVAAAVTIPVVGTLLIFSLLVGPAAAATYLTLRPLTAMLAAAGIALLATWAGLIAAYDTGRSIGFFISAFVGICYAAARLLGPLRSRRAARPRTSERQAQPGGGDREQHALGEEAMHALGIRSE